ncbi:MAG TPA: hypothetical protein VM532_05905 [Burkholderiales bacterium]|jgi:hypothetical protein|nr:hypothetical protein [Burkholderiales bacterium]
MNTDETPNTGATNNPPPPSLAQDEIATLRKQKALIDKAQQEQGTLKEHLENLSNFLRHLSEKHQQDFVRRYLQSMETQNQLMQERQKILMEATIQPPKDLTPDVSQKVSRLYDLVAAYLQSHQVSVQQSQLDTLQAYFAPQWLTKEIKWLKGDISFHEQRRNSISSNSGFSFSLFKRADTSKEDQKIADSQVELEPREKLFNELNVTLEEVMQSSKRTMLALAKQGKKIMDSYKSDPHSVTAEQLIALDALIARNLQEQIRLEDAFNKRIFQMQAPIANQQAEPDSVHMALQSLDKHIASRPDADEIRRQQPDKLEQMKLAEARLAELQKLQKWQELQRQRLRDLCQPLEQVLITTASDTTPASDQKFSLDSKMTQNAKLIIPYLIAALRTPTHQSNLVAAHRPPTRLPLFTNYKDAGADKTNYPNLSATTVFDDIATGTAYLLVEGGQGQAPGQGDKPHSSATVIRIDRKLLLEANVIAFGSKVTGSIKPGEKPIIGPALNKDKDKGRTSPGL